MKNVRILVIDDDDILIELLQAALSEEGWQVIAAKNGVQGLKIIEETVPDLVILDIVMPGLDGFTVCQQLRQWSMVPIIALSALQETKDKVKCLNLGADDYITKPFKINELVARIRVILRRNREGIHASTPPPLVCRDIKIDFEQRRVYLSGNEVKLTPTEYNLLATLASNPESSFTYTELLKTIWGQEYVDQREYLYVQINHLREKMEADAKNPRHIISVPKVGYRFKK